MTQAYPLSWPDGWPRTKYRSPVSRFQTTFDRARRDLYNEMRLLDVTSLVVSSNLPLRLDGQPRGDAARLRIEDPGVAVYFTLRQRPMVMARDEFQTVHDNLRSIGLAVAYLRGLERHGGAHMMERAFGGFAQLPPPAGGAAPVVSWREVLAPIPEGLDAADELVIAEARYRKLAAAAHADVGGSDEAMIVLNAAIAEARRELKNG